MKFKIGDNVIVHRIFPEEGQQYIQEGVIGLIGKVLSIIPNDEYPLRVKIKGKSRDAYSLKFEEVKKIKTNTRG